MEEFHILKDFKLISQIKENWCWAACGAMIADYFKIEVGHNSLLDFVKDGLNNPNCTINSEDCNKTLSADKIEELYENGFNIDCIRRSPSKINNFNFVKTTLKNNKSPLVGGISLSGGVNHLILIVGYGYCNNNNYLLVFDPKGSKLYTEYESNIFLHQNSPFNLLWETKLKTGNHDKNLQKIDNINEFINPKYELKTSYIVENENILFEKNRVIQKSNKKLLSIYKDSHFSITSLNSDFDIDCDSKIEIFVANPTDIYSIEKNFRIYGSDNLKLTTFSNFFGVYSLTEINNKFNQNYNLPHELEEFKNENINKFIKKIKI